MSLFNFNKLNIQGIINRGLKFPIYQISYSTSTSSSIALKQFRDILQKILMILKKLEHIKMKELSHLHKKHQLM